MAKTTSTRQSPRATTMACSSSSNSRAVVATPLAAETSTRKLSARDSQLLLEHLSKPTKPNAALRAAARKYWQHG